MEVEVACIVLFLLDWVWVWVFFFYYLGGREGGKRAYNGDDTVVLEESI